jgi:hypothetical protein
MQGSGGLPSVAFPCAKIKLVRMDGTSGISRVRPGRYDGQGRFVKAE